MSDQTERLKSFDNSKLIDVVKNYKQYGYDDDLRNSAIDILKSRGIEENDLKLTGNFESLQFNSARAIAKSYAKNSKITFLFYGIALVTPILTQLVAIKSESLGWAFLIIEILSLILFLVFLLRSFINQNNFYKTIEKKLETGDQVIYLIVGMPLYILMYFYYRQKMTEEMKMIKE